MTDFQEKVKDVVRNIPKGSVLTYKDVAIAAGRPNAYRSVASVMSKNYDGDVPCHRVIKSDGTIGEYNRGGGAMKSKLLQAEGFKITKL